MSDAVMVPRPKAYPLSTGQEIDLFGHRWVVKGIHLGALGQESLIHLEGLSHEPGWTGPWEFHPMLFVPEIMLSAAMALAASTPVGGWEDALLLLRTINRECDIGPYEADVLSLIDRLAAPPPPSVSTGSRPQEAVPTEGHGAAVLDALTWVLPMAKGYAAAHPVGNNAGIIEAAEEALARARSRPVVASVTLEGRQGEPAGMMTVTLHMSDGREVPIIRDNGNIISHWARVDAATPQPADGCSSNEGAGA